MTFDLEVSLPVMNPLKFTSWNRLRRVTAWVRRFACDGIRWYWNPPLGSHFGGVFESLVKVAMKTLRTVVGNAGLTDDELQSAINAVEALMNSRSLTYQGADPRDEPVLTLNHFLVGKLGGQLAPQVTDDIAFNPRNRCRLIQNLVKLFWKRWGEEFLSILNTRKKWRAAKDNLKVGDCSILVQRPNALTEHKTFFNHRQTRTRGLMPLTAHCVCVTQDAYTTGM